MMFTIHGDKLQNNMQFIYLIAIVTAIKYIIDNTFYMKYLYARFYNKIYYRTSIQMDIRIQYSSKYNEYSTVCGENTQALLWEYLSNTKITNRLQNLLDFPLNLDIKKLYGKNDYHTHYLLAIDDKPIEIYKDIYII